MSCKNDEIEIKVSETLTPEPQKSLKLNISTTTSYEKYGLDDYKNYLGSNESAYIAITSLLYNSNGNLVDSVSSYSRTFKTLYQNLEGLYNGSYTVVTFETLVDRGNNYKSEFWQLKDINSLESVQVYNVHYKDSVAVPWQYSIGVSTQKFEINSADQQIDLSPKPIGVLLDFEYDNFEKSGDVVVWFMLKNIATGYCLNPSLSPSERYTYDEGYNKNGYWSPRTEIRNDNGLPNSGKGKFYMLESGRLNYAFGDSEEYGSFKRECPSNDSYFDFTDGDYYKTYCYFTGYAYPLLTFVGTTSDFNTWKANMSKELDKLNSMPVCENPYIKWGATMSEVETYLQSKNYSIMEKAEENSALAIWGKNKESAYVYYFDKSGKLYYVNIFFAKVVTIANLLEYAYSVPNMQHSYYDDTYYYFISDDKKTGMTIWATTVYNMLQFYDNTHSNDGDLSFAEPCLDWGTSMSSVKSFMSDRDYSIMYEGDTYLFYNPKYKEKYTYYVFDSNMLIGAIVYFDKSVMSLSELEEEVKKTGASFGYTFESLGTIYYSADGKSYICIDADDEDDGIFLQYWEKNSSTNSTRSATSMEEPNRILKARSSELNTMKWSDSDKVGYNRFKGFAKKKMS